MSEGDNETDDSQKTEEPTARRLEEARKRGQVVYSREVSTWAILFAATLLVVMAGPGIMADLRDTLSRFLADAGSIKTEGTSLHRLLSDLFWHVMGALALPLLVLAAAGILSGFIQTGPIFTFDPVKPDISKISVFQGFKRLFSLRSIMEFVKGIAKLVIVSAAAIFVLLPYFGGIEHFVGQDIHAAMLDLRILFLKMMVAVLCVLFLVAVFDYLYQRHDFMSKMRMSKQEIREEFKQTEGDPQIKARLKELREKKARQRMMQAVPEADVVITNPTHFAVALKYDSRAMDAPKMVAKGADLVAQKIREVAAENKVPIVENAPLARALYDSMEIEQTIPHEHYKAVAEVISYVFRLKGKKL
ncbi:MAG: flagellar biosynthesis protein FlhB [Alphaproteobacteria bacterium]|nr:MAG: flagellar biosynthesis protein FlhB [Alphaproteobacteria bacterium]